MGYYQGGAIYSFPCAFWVTSHTYPKKIKKHDFDEWCDCHGLEFVGQAQ